MNRTKQVALLKDKVRTAETLVRGILMELAWDQGDSSTLTADSAAVLHDLHLLDQTVQSALRTAVGMARQEGLSWALVGAPLGVSPQAAQQRWAKVVE
jgi:hypothetical protein